MVSSKADGGETDETKEIGEVYLVQFTTFILKIPLFLQFIVLSHLVSNIKENLRLMWFQVVLGPGLLGGLLQVDESVPVPVRGDHFDYGILHCPISDDCSKSGKFDRVELSIFVLIGLIKERSQGLLVESVMLECDSLGLVHGYCTRAVGIHYLKRDLLHFGEAVTHLQGLLARLDGTRADYPFEIGKFRGIQLAVLIVVDGGHHLDSVAWKTKRKQEREEANSINVYSRILMGEDLIVEGDETFRLARHVQNGLAAADAQLVAVSTAGGLAHFQRGILLRQSDGIDLLGDEGVIQDRDVAGEAARRVDGGRRHSTGNRRPARAGTGSGRRQLVADGAALLADVAPPDEFLLGDGTLLVVHPHATLVVLAEAALLQQADLVERTEARPIESGIGGRAHGQLAGAILQRKEVSLALVGDRYSCGVSPMD